MLFHFFLFVCINKYSNENIIYINVWIQLEYEVGVFGRTKLNVEVKWFIVECYLFSKKETTKIRFSFLSSTIRISPQNRIFPLVIWIYKTQIHHYNSFICAKEQRENYLPLESLYEIQTVSISFLRKKSRSFLASNFAENSIVCRWSAYYIQSG